MKTTRRDALKATLLGSAGAALAPSAAAAQDGACQPAWPTWARGVENQRIADLGDGTFLNPVLAGDYADPTVLKDGGVYYMTHTSHDATPGILLWRSTDLVNWSPMAPILNQPIGSVWAMDLIKHRGRFYLYIPATPGGRQTVMVMHARRMEGPWSDPIDLEIPHIDPGHVVGEDGKRYLYVAGGRRVRLTDDGLAKDGPLEENAYQLWRYPEDWVVEMYAPEGPKFIRRNGYFYLVAAVGGTAGPPTSHMVVVSRSRSVHGPWEQCPHNPIVRTVSASERWWSRGHATVVEGPRGDDWWMIYHGYENGYRTLGRHVLLDPIEWTTDGWPRARGGDLSQPIAKPRGGRGAIAARPLSDDFSRNRFGELWRFHRPAPNESARVRYADGALMMRGKGSGPENCSPITCIAGDHAYEFSVTMETSGAQGGALLFYSERAHVGLGFNGAEMFTYAYGQEHSWMRAPVASNRVHLKITNDRQIATMHYSTDGATWVKHPWQFDVSPLNQNAFGNFLSLRPALYACGEGEVRFSDFRYRALD